MICGVCGKEFFPKYHQRRYCCKKHTQRAQHLKRKKLKPDWFAKEWAAWQRDFANGLTQSNSEICHER